MAVVRGVREQANRGRPPEKEGNKKYSSFNKMIVIKNQKRKRATFDDLYDNDAVKSHVMMRATEIQKNLAPKFPSMVKVMLPSHVTGGFWLGLSKQFCCKHMPKEDTIILLEDESGKTYLTKYLTQKVGLSGGWRGFSIDQNLVAGDAVVFHLVKPTRFKVYIVRVNGSEEVDGALGLLKLDASEKRMNLTGESQVENSSMACEDILVRDLRPMSGKKYKENIQKASTMACGTNPASTADHSENGSEDFGFEISDGIRLSESVVDFKDVKSFDDFDILVNGLVINTELSKHLQKKYYELCCSQNAFLHDQLLQGLNCKLIAGIIAETINIADAIRASKDTTSQEDFAAWEKTLKAFEGLGLNVGFLLARLGRLTSLAAKSRRHKETRVERVNAEEEMRALEVKLVEVRQKMGRLDVEIETLEVNDENFEQMFQETAKAPW